MSDTIVSAIIGAIGAIIVCLITQFFLLKKSKAESQAEREEMFNRQNESISELKHEMSLIRYILDELTKHVEKHNQVIDRTYALEKRADVMDEQIKVINHRISDLEAMN